MFRQYAVKNELNKGLMNKQQKENSKSFKWYCDYGIML